jgi:hypothetical protein
MSKVAQDDMSQAEAIRTIGAISKVKTSTARYATRSVREENYCRSRGRAIARLSSRPAIGSIVLNMNGRQ